MFNIFTDGEKASGPMTMSESVRERERWDVDRQLLIPILDRQTHINKEREREREEGC